MPDRRFIAAPNLFVGGKVVAARGILLDGGSIETVVTRDDPVDLDGIVTVDEFPNATVLPGLVDAHVHLCLAHGEDLHRTVDEALVEKSSERGSAVAAELVRLGVTAARDLGCRGDSAQRVRDAASRGDLTLTVSGRPVTTPGGHFSSFGIAVRGVDAVRSAVGHLADEGADLVKVMATGGMLTPGTAPGRAQFSLEELRALVGKAHDQGLRVAAHAHGTTGIALSVEAGVDTIEHCSWLGADGRLGSPDPSLVERIVDAGQTVVLAGPLPDVLAGTGRDGGPSATAPDGPAVDSLRRAWRNMMVLRHEGVRVALGTDSIFGQFPDHTDLAHRAEAMVRHGSWRPGDVVDLMTEGGAAALGRADQIGRLAPGARADLVVLGGDPSTDISALRRVLAVYREGRRVA